MGALWGRVLKAADMEQDIYSRSVGFARAQYTSISSTSSLSRLESHGFMPNAAS